MPSDMPHACAATVSLDSLIRTRTAFGNVPGQYTPQFTRASKACEPLLPDGGQPTQAQITSAGNAGLKIAQCMRTQGSPTFADPKVLPPIEPSGRVGFAFGFKPSMGIDTNSLRYQAAGKICEGQ
jgi:hypothetical protein